MFIITLSRTCVQRTCLLSSTKLKARSGSGKSWSQQRKRKKIKHKPVIFLSCPWKVLRCMDGIPITAPNVCSTAWLPPTSWLNMTILGLISKATFFFCHCPGYVATSFYTFYIHSHHSEDTAVTQIHRSVYQRSWLTVLSLRNADKRGPTTILSTEAHGQSVPSVWRHAHCIVG